MPSIKRWETPAELDLCMAIIMTGGSSGSYNWPEVHAIMTRLGHSFTKDAISQHFTKTILRGFKNRHGLGAGKLADALPMGRRRKFEDADVEEEDVKPAKKRMAQ